MQDSTIVTKAEKLLALYALLNNRTIVPVSVASKFCNISERTAYRYFNSLSEAGIAVVFDKGRAGYRLDPSANFPLKKIFLGDTVLILLALEFLSISVDDTYRDVIRHLSHWIEAASDYKLDGIHRMIESELPRQKSISGLTELISTLLIHAAISNEKAVSIMTKSQNDGATPLKVNLPRLFYEDYWSLTSGDSRTKCKIKMSDIKKVSIVQ